MRSGWHVITLSSLEAPGHFPCHSIKEVSIMTNLMYSEDLSSYGAVGIILK